MSEQDDFNEKFERLTPTEQHTLELLIRGKSDREIAHSRNIAPGTVRKTVQNICDTLQIESNGASRRPALVSHVLQYKPELVRQETTPQEDAPEPEIEQETQSDRNFVGREKAITDINTLIQRGERCILILSPGGVGKTVLAERYLQQRFQTVVRFDIAKERQNVSSAESLVEEKLRFLGEEPGREFGVSLARLRTKLESEKIGVLVDNLEPALGEEGRFIENHRSYVDLMRVLCGSSVRSVTLITSREKVAENLDIEVYPLERLSLEAWKEYFQQQEIDTDTPVLGEIHQAYRGNALAMKMLRSRIAADHDNSIEDYWKFHRTQEGVVVEQAIANLIIEQFDRLQQVCPTAYQLLYRMGCFRFQDVPTVPKEGLLCLLWGVAEHEGLRAIRDLGDRGLCDRVNGEYKLHPLIRQEALKRLQDSDEWEKANRTAAEFWTDWVKSIETVADANNALEAYYHYLEIKDYEKCAHVICKTRMTYPLSHDLIYGTSLGSSCIRLGIYQQIYQAIDKIIVHISPHYFSNHLYNIYNILGDILWITGQPYSAIEFHHQSGEIAELILTELPSYSSLSRDELQKIKAFEILSDYNIALCKIDIGEFDQGVCFLKKVMQKTEKSDVFIGYFVRALTHLASIDASLGHLESATRLVTQLESLKHIQLGVRSTGYRFYHLGKVFEYLNDFQKSLDYYQKAQDYCQKIKFLQGEGITLTGMARLYCIQNDYEAAFSYHTQAIAILEKLGAKCDLAEAYYQLGLTYQETGELAQSQDYFNRAIELWEKINAPKLIARVRGAINN